MYNVTQFVQGLMTYIGYIQFVPMLLGQILLQIQISIMKKKEIYVGFPTTLKGKNTLG